MKTFTSLPNRSPRQMNGTILQRVQCKIAPFQEVMLTPAGYLMPRKVEMGLKNALFALHRMRNSMCEPYNELLVNSF